MSSSSSCKFLLYANSSDYLIVICDDISFRMRLKRTPGLRDPKMGNPLAFLSVSMALQVPQRANQVLSLLLVPTSIHILLGFIHPLPIGVDPLITWAVYQLLPISINQPWIICHFYFVIFYFQLPIGHLGQQLPSINQRFWKLLGPFPCCSSAVQPEFRAAAFVCAEAIAEQDRTHDLVPPDQQAGHAWWSWAAGFQESKSCHHLGVATPDV